MPDKKLIDKEIVKALECVIECNNGLKKYCIGCLLKKHYPYCEERVIEYALDLINRQEEEIERLKKENKLLINNDVSNKYPNCVLVEKGRIYTKTLDDYDNLIGDISKEGIKEFAEAVKKDFDNPNIQKYGLDYVNFLKGIVDRRLKESVGA